MIGKFKEACGYSDTMKMQLMITDSQSWDTMNGDYRAQMPAASSHPAITVQVCRSNAWPYSQSLNEASNESILPATLEPSLAAFRDFYTRTHNNHKLLFLHEQATVGANFVGAGGVGSRRLFFLIPLIPSLSRTLLC